VGTQSVVSAFESVDINAAPAGGTTVVDADTAFDVTAGGADINGAADRFRFVHEQLTGDFDIRVRLESLSKASAWTKAGLMARENLGPGSRNVFVLATPDVNGYRISSRLSEGGSTLVTGAAGAAVAYPNTWLRLRRTGGTFTGYRSTDGVNWFVLGSRTVNLPATLHFGMAATSHNTAATATAKFRDLSNVPKPDPQPVERLVGIDVGGAAPAGATSVVRQGSDYDLTAGGTDVNGATDRFHFAYRQVTGDFDVKVRLQSLGATSDWAKAGIMAREDLTTGSRNVFALATPGANGYRVSSRSDASGSTFVSGSGAVSYPNTWLRLRRRGDSFDAYRSTDGVAWTQIGTTRTIDLPDTIHLGLAATSHNTQAATRAEFREFGNV